MVDHKHLPRPDGLHKTLHGLGGGLVHLHPLHHGHQLVANLGRKGALHGQTAHLLVHLIYKNIDHTVPYDYELENYIKVGDYKELPYYKETAEVSDEDVDTEIKSRLEKAAKSEQVKEGTVTEGDSVNIAYVGKIDGEEFEGGKSDSYDLEIGSGTFIDGFESGLTGHSIGETVVLNLRFPEDYHNADVAGKPVEFTVTINYKTVKETPELDEGFVKDNTKTGSKTVDAYKKEVKEELLKKKQDSIDNAMKDEL